MSRQEALSEDRDGEQSVTGSMLGPAGLPSCHRALRVVSKEEIWVVLFFFNLTLNTIDSKMSLARKPTGRLGLSVSIATDRTPLGSILNSRASQPLPAR